jgi:hypothetical protein
MFARAVAVLMLAATPVAAEELAAKLCPLLETVAANSEGKADYAVQADLLFSVVGTYGTDGDELKALLEGIDAAANASCPQARETILARTGKSSLASALR